jgi:uncharacterized protein
MFLMVAALLAQAGGDGKSQPERANRCTDAWERFIEDTVSTGDGRGHGPDLGSDEWQSVVQFRLGIRDEPGVPERGGEAWCHFIDRIVQDRSKSTSASPGPGSAARNSGPSFSCDEVEAGSVEAMICSDEELSTMDRKLAGVYAAASAKATNEHPPVLKAEQRDWIKGRDACFKGDDKRDCIRDAYLHRIAELQARYRLVSFIGPASFVCDDNRAKEVIAMFFETDPPTLIAEYGDSVSLMYVQPSASGSRYQGSNEAYWEHQGEALITWDDGATQMHCRKAQ